MNVKKGIIALLIFPLFIISMMPLSVSADTTTNTAPFIGVNIQVTGYGENQTSITYPALNINEISANQSTAYIHGQLNCTSPSTPTSSTPCDVFSFANNNGNSSASYGTAIDLNLQNYFLKFNGNATVNGINYFFVDYEFILDDNYKGYVTVTDENSVSKTIYVNGNNFHYQRMQDDLTQHTFTITDYDLLRIFSPLMWQFPIESLSAISTNLNHEIVGFTDYSLWKYPQFSCDVGTYVFNHVWTTKGDGDLTVVLVVDSNDAIDTLTRFNSQFTYNSRYSVKTFQKISYTSNTGSLFKVVFSISSSGFFELVNQKNINYFIPIYFGQNNENLSTDFALEFGLSNRLLDDIEHIANGTTNSNASVSSADQQNDTFKDQSSDLITQEEEFTSNMKQNLQQIDTSFTFNNFGNKFMSSAVWVRDQYDHMITNTPFGTLVTFSMLLGLGLLIIGRTVNK